MNVSLARAENCSSLCISQKSPVAQTNLALLNADGSIADVVKDDGGVVYESSFPTEGSVVYEALE